jgi:hypothetical protein
MLPRTVRLMRLGRTKNDSAYKLFIYTPSAVRSFRLRPLTYLDFARRRLWPNRAFSSPASKSSAEAPYTATSENKQGDAPNTESPAPTYPGVILNNPDMAAAQQSTVSFQSCFQDFCFFLPVILAGVIFATCV